MNKEQKTPISMHPFKRGHIVVVSKDGMSLEWDQDTEAFYSG